jgi:hypothetical protein
VEQCNETPFTPRHAHGHVNQPDSGVPVGLSEQAI